MGRDVVVVGGSAGGVSALCQLLRSLPKNLPAAIAITLHRGPSQSEAPGADSFVDLLNNLESIPCLSPLDGQLFAPGFVYVAPPDFHMLLKDDFVRLERGPKENHARPAIDPMFRTTAATYGPRVVGVLLTGNLSDGVHGLCTIKDHGGLTLVQSPEEAAFPSMPRAAINANCADRVLPIAGLASTLTALVLAGER